ncbi:MAG: extracellular solute-binding protein [Chloroflexi bacterium]|nr:extracellular solute-binding protein [Chloroflexota bacterium]MBV9603310.1 extracellular solute-binding protein [Chloroflexota bacterium]
MTSRLVGAALAVSLLLAACNTGGTAGGAPAAGGTPSAAGAVQFLSTQYNTVDETTKMNNVILKDSPVPTNFQPSELGPFNDRLTAEQKAAKVTVGLVGGQHGDFAPLVTAGYMDDVTQLVQQLADRNFPPKILDLSKFGTDKNYYVPWAQATYVLAINKKAMQYLPQGADVNALTYDQLAAWGTNIASATGQRKVGFPDGPKGLFARFFEGYLYPSFTGSAGVVAFKSPEAVSMWTSFRDMWKAAVSPQSTSYDFMQEPLMSEEVWIAWDHTARLIDAASQQPDNFMLVPAPAGPKGRGFMPVITGLGIPKGTPDRASSEKLIEYLTQPQTQINTLTQLAFFPATGAQIPTELPPGVKLEADAVAKQSSAPDAVPSLLPVGLGAQGNEFNKVYTDTFTRIVINNEEVQGVLNDEGGKLQALIDQAGASCWAPDPPSNGPCKVQ